MPQLRSLTPKQEDRRKRILAAARNMVADFGYDGMVMSQVAELAGVSPTTLYNLYNTKDELVLEALRELLVESQRELKARSPGPGWKYLLARVRNGARMADDEPAYAEAITHALLRASSGDSLVEILLEGGVNDTRRSIEAMADRGELLPGVDLDQLATTLTGVYWSSFMMWNKGLVRLVELETLLQINLLAVLMASTHGRAHDDMQDIYQSLLRKAP